MAIPQLRTLIQHLRRSVSSSGEDTLTDAQLLRRWADQRDEAAFEVLLWRHGPMVLAVCRRLLHGSHDIEDAFQATFLTLVRKGASIRRPEAVAAWLHRVAYRIALRLRGALAERARHERSGIEAMMSGSRDGTAADDLRAVLDAEIDALPECYRRAFILCCLEGKTHAEAARLLGRPPGTVSCWLKRGRERLRGRLMRRGIAPAAIAALGEGQMRDTMASVLVKSACRAAKLLGTGGKGVEAAVSERVFLLVDGALKGTAAMKLQWAMVLVLALGMSAAGVGLLAYQVSATQRPQPEAKLQAAEQPRGQEERPARTDLYGDPLPPGALARLGTVRLRQQGVDMGLTAIAPDGKTLATLGGGEVRLWDIGTGKLLWRTGKDYRAPSLIFSPDGKQLAATDGQSACLLDAATRRLRCRLPTEDYVLAFSPDGKRAITGSNDGRVQVWQTETGRQAFSLRGHKAAVWLGAFTPDGQALITADRANKICRWNMTDGTLKKSLDIAAPPFRAHCLSADGRTLAVAPSSREAVRLYDTETGKLRCALQGDRTTTRYVLAFTPDGRTLATDWAEPWGEQVMISLWDARTGKSLRRFTVPDAGVFDLSCAPDGRILATGGQGSAFRLWDSITGKPLLTWPAHSGPIQALAFTPDGRHLVSCDGQTLRLWEVPSGRHVRQLNREARYRQHDLAITADGRSVLAGGYIQVRLNDLPSGEERRLFLLDEHPEKLPKPTVTLPGHTVQRLGFSADGRTAVCVSSVPRELQPRNFTNISEAYVWDLATGQLLACRELGNSLNFHLLGITPGSTATIEHRSTLPSRGPISLEQEANSNQIVLRDLRTGRHRVTLAVPDFFRCYACAVSPDERTLVTATLTATQGDKEIRWGTSTIRFWELASGKERMTIVSHQAGWPFSFQKFAFASDGRTLATARPDRTVQVWDAATGAELLRRTGSPSRAVILTFAPDGQTLATGNDDSTILLWDTATPKRPGDKSGREPGAKELDQWWSTLAGKDAHPAWAAIWKMIEAPQQVVPFLRQRLRPAASLPADEVRRLLADLDSAEFAKREAASARLAEFDDRIVPAVEDALKNAKSAELRRRLKDLLPTSQVIRSPETLRQVRAIEVLEHIGTTEAQQVLTTLSRGMAEARVTQEAKAALERLSNHRGTSR